MRKKNNQIMLNFCFVLKEILAYVIFMKISLLPNIVNGKN